MKDFVSGFQFLPEALDRTAQESLRDEIRSLLPRAPLFQPAMPRSGKPLSVRMTSFGSHGWVSDQRRGYRYQARHPATGQPWPEIPESLRQLWDSLTAYEKSPQCCLVNFYDKGARMGLHQDRDEEDRQAPVLSISLGDEALFRIGGQTRRDPTQSLRLRSGDIVILAGQARHCFHGIDRLYHNSGSLLRQGGRINVTLRRVTH